MKTFIGDSDYSYELNISEEALTILSDINVRWENMPDKIIERREQILKFFEGENILWMIEETKGIGKSIMKLGFMQEAGLRMGAIYKGYELTGKTLPYDQFLLAIGLIKTLQ